MITWVIESPTRYAAWMNPGSSPSSANVGTITGAISAHIAEPEVMNRLITDAISTSPSTAKKPVIPMASSASASLTAITVPSPLQVKIAITWAAMKMNTTYPASPRIASVIISGTSAAFETARVITP